MRILVVGGGIGGLTTALALRQAGWEVQVFERAPEIREVGAGLTLWHNAMFVLDQLGVGTDIRHAGFSISLGKIGTADGKVLLQMKYDDFPQHRCFQHTIAIHRATLVQCLSQHLPPDSIVVDAQCDEIQQTPEQVTLRLHNGRTFQGDLLVGADGIHSTVRRLLWRPQQLRYAGYTCWRGIASFAANNMKHVGEFWGRGQRFGMIPIAENRVYWFAVVNMPQGCTSDPEHRKAEVQKLFASWAWDIPAIIEATPNEAIIHNDIVDLPPSRPWSQGRVVLLGDAIHPTTPNMGQGACMAIESALSLANALQQHSSHTEAFRVWETERFRRTSTITKRSRIIGSIGHWSNPIACWLRNWFIRLSPARSQIKGLLPIIGHEIKAISPSR